MFTWFLQFSCFLPVFPHFVLNSLHELVLPISISFHAAHYILILSLRLNNPMSNSKKEEIYLTITHNIRFYILLDHPRLMSTIFLLFLSLSLPFSLSHSLYPSLLPLRHIPIAICWICHDCM